MGHMAYLRANAKYEAIKKAAAQTIEIIGKPPHKTRVSTRVAKHVLLAHATFMYNGVMYETFTKSIGAGVHEVYAKPLQP